MEIHINACITQYAKRGQSTLQYFPHCEPPDGKADAMRGTGAGGPKEAQSRGHQGLPCAWTLVLAMQRSRYGHQHSCYYWQAPVTLSASNMLAIHVPKSILLIRRCLFISVNVYIARMFLVWAGRIEGVSLLL